eukprot:COSAG05_NODE_6411_length_963_cov_1.070602_2_plen_128_part_01
MATNVGHFLQGLAKVDWRFSVPTHPWLERMMPTLLRAYLPTHGASYGAFAWEYIFGAWDGDYCDTEVSVTCTEGSAGCFQEDGVWRKLTHSCEKDIRKTIDVNDGVNKTMWLDKNTNDAVQNALRGVG